MKKSLLKWKLVDYEFDEEEHGEIVGALHKYKIFTQEDALTTGEIAMVCYHELCEGWEDDAPELTWIDEHIHRLNEIIANPKKRRHYEDVEAIVGDNWMWFTKPPKLRKVTLNDNSRAILRSVAANMERDNGEDAFSRYLKMIADAKYYPQEWPYHN